MKTGWALLFGIVCGLLAAGAILLASSPPRGHPIHLLPAPTPIPIQIQVDGEVKNPGVYALAKGSRLQEAIIAAGGCTKDADDSSLNLVSTLQDGQRIWIPSQAESEALSLESENSQIIDTSKQGPSIQISTLININTATQDEFESLPGIGPVTAEKIINYRDTNGAFMSIEEIQNVSGIGPATFEKIKEFITVDDIQ